MAYFECIVGNGGGGGSTDIPLIVNCDAQFAGLIITASQTGQSSLTETCPSTSPYQVVFHLPADGTWTISGTIRGTSYSESITISAYEVDLYAGFEWEEWVTLGGLDPTDYSSLSDVFADEEATRRLMLVHASADYLIGKVTEDVDTLDDFVANDTAMKWLGLCDYVCDGIVAITGAEAKLMASTYWERYLKDHVPTMTSDTAPYGTVLSDSQLSGNERWHAFDNNADTEFDSQNLASSGHWIGYHFTNPINVRKFHRHAYADNTTFKIGYSDDGSSWTELDTTYTQDAVEKDFSVEDVGYHLYWRLYHTGNGNTRFATIEVQFYGRALNVSVPVMTNNTTPYGEAFSPSYYSGQPAYRAFDGDKTTQTAISSPEPSGYVGYKFVSQVRIKKAIVTTYYDHGRLATIQGSNTGNTNDWHDASEVVTINGTNPQAYIITGIDCTASDTYSYWRLYSEKLSTDVDNYYNVNELKFYGVDYSEKEFEAGTTRKWLYDHGVELETITAYPNASKSANGYLEVANQTSSASANYFEVSSMDLSSYSLIRARAGDTLSSSNGYLNVGKPTQAIAYKTFGSDPNNIYLGISSVSSGSPVITRNASSKINEWWLE